MTADPSPAQMSQGLGTEAEDSALAALDRIRAREPEINAFIEVLEGGVTDAARRLDALSPGRRGPLHGLPVAIKEIIDVAGALCPWGSAAQSGRRALESAELVTRLTEAGALVTGTVVSTEYAIARAGPTRNPRDISRTPGGSSSGPAAAVAAGMVPAAIGTQTVGSIIRPALYCGIPGFKPSHGRISLKGVMPLQPLLDHVGILAESWEVAGRVFAVLDDGQDGGSPAIRRVLRVPAPAHVSLSASSTAAMTEACERLMSAGHRIEPSPELADIRSETEALAQDLVAIGMAQFHARDLMARSAHVSPGARALIEKGQTFSRSRVQELEDRVAELRTWVDDLIRPGDLVVSDAVEDVAPAWAPDRTGPNALQAVWSVFGLPTAAWPLWTDPGTGMPTGVQVTAARHCDGWLIDRMAELAAA